MCSIFLVLTWNNREGSDVISSIFGALHLLRISLSSPTDMKEGASTIHTIWLLADPPAAVLAGLAQATFLGPRAVCVDVTAVCYI